MPVYYLSSCELLSWQAGKLGSHPKNIRSSKSFWRPNRSLNCRFCKINPLISTLYLSRAVEEDLGYSLSNRTAWGACLLTLGRQTPRWKDGFPFCGRLCTLSWHAPLQICALRRRIRPKHLNSPCCPVLSKLQTYKPLVPHHPPTDTRQT